MSESENTYWFKHNLNAHNVEEVIDLRMELGMLGYGIYWMLFELLGAADNYELETNYKRLAFSIGCDHKTVEKVVNDFNLFVVENKVFYSVSLKKRMEKLDQIRLKRVIAGRTGGLKKAKARQLLDEKLAIAKQVLDEKLASASHLPVESEANAKQNPSEPKQSQAEKRRGDKKREEESKDLGIKPPPLKDNLPFSEGDSDFFGDYEMFCCHFEMNGNFQSAKFRAKAFWDHWKTLEWKDSNDVRVGLKRKAVYEFQNFEKFGRSAYFGEGPKQNLQDKITARQNNVQENIDNGGPFKDEESILEPQASIVT